jgi:hypothetical protein
MGQFLFFTVIAVIGLIILFARGNTTNAGRSKNTKKKALNPDVKSKLVKKAKTESWMENKWDQPNKDVNKNRR